MRINGHTWRFRTIRGRQFLDNGKGPEECVAIIHGDLHVVTVADSAPIDEQLAAVIHRFPRKE